MYVCARARAHTNLGKKDLRAAAGIDKRICKQQHAHTNTQVNVCVVRVRAREYMEEKIQRAGRIRTDVRVRVR